MKTFTKSQKIKKKKENIDYMNISEILVSTLGRAVKAHALGACSKERGFDPHRVHFYVLVSNLIASGY